nr:hypothetical protein [uncultured Mucilaginibacter sp.]
MEHSNDKSQIFSFPLDEFYLDLQRDGKDIVYLTEDEIEENPFPGLRPFRTKEVPVFKGRYEQVKEVLRKLAERNFLAIIGSSGTGKSSLVRAGLIPQLFGGYLDIKQTDWRIAICRPGDNPIQNLSVSLSSLKCGSIKKEDIAKEYHAIEALLLESTYGLLDFNKELQAERSTSNKSLLIIIDQFEEIFRYEQERPAAENLESHFINLLLNASSKADNRIYVILTMRSEFLGDCVKFKGLPEAINAGQYLVPQLTGKQLREVIEAPIARASKMIDPNLAELLVNEIEQSQSNIDSLDYLPILQHTLMRTYQKAGLRSTISLEDYNLVGGIKKSLSDHADTVFNELADDVTPPAISRKQKIAKIVFQALTDASTDLKGGRRPTTVKEIYAIAKSESLRAEEWEVDEVINHFRKEDVSFIMPSESTRLYPDLKIDISHESLMRNWGTLKSWMEEEVIISDLYKTLNSRRELNEKSFYKDQWILGGLLQDVIRWRDEHPVNAAWASRYHQNTKGKKNNLLSDEEIFEKNKGFLERSEEKQAELYQKEIDIATTEQRAALAIEEARVANLEMGLARQQAALANRKRRVYLALVAAAVAVIGLSIFMLIKQSNISNAGFSLAAINNVDTAKVSKKAALKILIKARANFNALGVPASIAKDGPSAAEKKILDIYNYNNLGSDSLVLPEGLKNRNLDIFSYTPLFNDKLMLAVYDVPVLNSNVFSSYPLNGYGKKEPEKQPSKYSAVLFNNSTRTAIGTWDGRAYVVKNSNLIAVVNASVMKFYKVGNTIKKESYFLTLPNDLESQITSISYYEAKTQKIALICTETSPGIIYDLNSGKKITDIGFAQAENKNPRVLFCSLLKDGNVLLVESVNDQESLQLNNGMAINSVQVFIKDKAYTLGTKVDDYYSFALSPTREQFVVKRGNDDWLYYRNGNLLPIGLKDSVNNSVAKYDQKNNLVIFDGKKITLFDHLSHFKRERLLGNTNLGKSLLDFKNNIAVIKRVDTVSKKPSTFTLELIDLEKNYPYEIFSAPININPVYSLSNNGDSLIVITDLASTYQNSAKTYDIYSTKNRGKLGRLISRTNLNFNNGNFGLIALNGTVNRDDYEEVSILFKASYLKSESYYDANHTLSKIQFYDMLTPPVKKADDVKQIIDWVNKTIILSAPEQAYIKDFMHRTSWATITN